MTKKAYGQTFGSKRIPSQNPLGGQTSVCYQLWHHKRYYCGKCQRITYCMYWY